MTEIKVVNLSQNTVLGDHIEMAETFWTRGKGLLGKRYLSNNQGLLIKPCKQVHSFGMKFTIDVVFIDQNWRVCHLHPYMLPGLLSKYVRKAKYVLEVPAGKISESRTRIGDLIKIEKEGVI